MRAALVNSAVLAEKAAVLNLGLALRLGKGEERSGGRVKLSILSGAFEALLAPFTGTAATNLLVVSSNATLPPISKKKSSANRITKPGCKRSARCYFAHRRTIG